jgi:hypothetical protein
LAGFLAVEEWENSKRTEGEWERWWLTCSNYTPVVGGGELRHDSCTLDRLFVTSSVPPAVTTMRYDTDEGTLKIAQVDWSKGVLDLTVVSPVRATIDVELRFIFDDDNIYLRSFRGASVLKDPLTTYEYRIPTYTTVLNIPLELKGWKSPGQKNWDTIETLSSQDQQAWKSMPSDQHAFPRTDPKRFAESAIAALADYDAIETGKRKATAAEEKLIDRLKKENMLASEKEWLSKSLLSPQGQGKILAYFSNVF